MNEKFLLITILGFSCYSLVGQTVNRDPSFMITGSGFLNTRTIEPELEGKTILYDDFRKGVIFFKSKNGSSKYESFINYDLYSSRLLIRLDSRTFELDGRQVDSVYFEVSSDSLLTLKNSSFFEGVKTSGLIHELYKGVQVHLVKQRSVEVIKPTYNELLNVGSRNYIVKPINRYFIRSGNSKTYRKFSIKKASFNELDIQKKHQKVIRDSSIDSDADLIKLLKVIDF